MCFNHLLNPAKMSSTVRGTFPPPLTTLDFQPQLFFSGSILWKNIFNFYFNLHLQDYSEVE